MRGSVSIRIVAPCSHCQYPSIKKASNTCDAALEGFTGADKWLGTDPAGHLFDGLTYLLQAAQEWQCQRDLRLQLGGYQVQVYAMDFVFLCARSLFEFFMGEGRRRRIDPGLGRGNHLCADLGANGRVDQRPHRLGE